MIILYFKYDKKSSLKELKEINNFAKKSADREYLLNTMISTIDPVLTKLNNSDNIFKILPKSKNCRYTPLLNIYEGFIRCFDGISLWLREDGTSKSENVLKEK